MDIDIVKGEDKYFDDCKIALQKSELGRVYFSEEKRVINAINEGISKGELYAAINKEGKCVGFIWFIKHGAFHSFPYLHIIAVKEEYRGLGIGRRLLKFFEDSETQRPSKLFLVVADFNPDAKRLYKSVGYREVGVIPDLYKKGVTEHLMMKKI